MDDPLTGDIKSTDEKGNKTEEREEREEKEVKRIKPSEMNKNKSGGIGMKFAGLIDPTKLRPGAAKPKPKEQKEDAGKIEIDASLDKPTLTQRSERKRRTRKKIIPGTEDSNDDNIPSVFQESLTTVVSPSQVDLLKQETINETNETKDSEEREEMEVKETKSNTETKRKQTDDDIIDNPLFNINDNNDSKKQKKDNVSIVLHVLCCVVLGGFGVLCMLCGCRW